MGDLFFAARTMVITVVIVILMQIKLGESTLETYAHEWVRSSSAVAVLRDVSHGAVVAVSRLYRTAASAIDATVSSKFSRDQMPGSRSLGLGFSRSAKYEEEQAEKRKAAERAAEEIVRRDEESDAEEPDSEETVREN